MKSTSLILSVMLHLAVLAFILYVPVKPPVDLMRPVYQVSLVMGAPGGEKLPSPVLGARPPVTGKQNISTEAGAPKPAEPAPAAAPAPADNTPAVPKPEAIKAKEPEPQKQNAPEPQKAPDPVQIAKKPEPRPQHKPEPKPQPKTDQKPPQKEQPKQDKKSQGKPDKSSSKKSGSDAIADALADARKSAKSSPANGKGSASSGNAASRALADLEKQAGRTGVGGGGGEGDGPGGGGIYDVYAAQVQLAVQPNWSMSVYSRSNMVVQVRIKTDKEGNILDCKVERSSGRAEYDASAVNAVIRTKKLPKPPTPAQQDVVISFNSLQMAGRR